MSEDVNVEIHFQNSVIKKNTSINNVTSSITEELKKINPQITAIENINVPQAAISGQPHLMLRGKKIKAVAIIESCEGLMHKTQTIDFEYIFR